MRKFEHVPRARKFLISTDLSVITFIQGLQEARGIFAQWLVCLSLFESDVLQSLVKANTAADALSGTLIRKKEKFPAQRCDAPVDGVGTSATKTSFDL